MAFIKYQKTEQDLKNILNYSTWKAGETQAVGFNRNGDLSENLLLNGIDPFGNETVLWEGRPNGNSNADGGWETNTFSIDKTKLYRFSVWVKRTIYVDGRFYFGLYGYGTTNGVLNRSTGVNNTNPYGYSTSDPPTTAEFPNKTWVLVVFHVWPDGSGTGSMHVDSGRYTTRSGKIGNVNSDFIWNSATATASHRTYLYYSTDPNPRQYWCYPRVDVVDGNEPKIKDLLLGYGATTKVLNATKNGNFFLGANQVAYGPTKETGFFSGIKPPIGGYTIYKYSDGLYPTVYVAADGNQLVNYLRRIRVGFTGDSINEALLFAQNNVNLFIQQS